ncbi:type IV toxin-antitoxin system AbiEi family antitoxin domain-containing protein [Arthrobacter sp. N1]|uniref:type IV toxin-antitoxin system AbiEi family antitoxin domain-containing protein n=1 Tax=Arthrobacter sp. N1 TaxID=619291 RepID=UPI003BB07EBD
MTVVHLLSELGGVARLPELVAAGTGRAAIAKACERGQVLRVARGIYALPDHDPVVVAALQLGTELASVSAAQHRGLWILRRPGLMHVATDHGRPIDTAGLRVHRAARPVTDLVVCLQVMRCLPELDALSIVESAVVRGSVTLDDLREHVVGHRSGTLRRIVALIDPQAESILETVARYRLLEAGFHVASQVQVSGVGRPDLVVDGVLGIEADGREYHSDRPAFEEDRRRGNLLTARGMPVPRVTWPLLQNDPDTFIRLVRAALEVHSAQ